MGWEGGHQDRLLLLLLKVIGGLTWDFLVECGRGVGGGMGLAPLLPGIRGEYVLFVEVS